MFNKTQVIFDILTILFYTVICTSIALGHGLLVIIFNILLFCAITYYNIEYIRKKNLKNNLFSTTSIIYQISILTLAYFVTKGKIDSMFFKYIAMLMFIFYAAIKTISYIKSRK